MKIYRVEYKDESQEHKGFTFHAVKKEAVDRALDYRRKCKGGETQVEPITVRVTAAGVLRALQAYASHPDNG